MTAGSAGGARAATKLCAGAATLLAVQVLLLAARPLATDDSWWHLKLGGLFAAQGLGIDADPLVHTARPGPPTRNAWLFDLTLHGVERVAGLHGLRALHAAAALASLALAFSLLRRETRSRAAACAGTAAFTLLAWWRLIQLRPDLVSIPCALVVYRLVLAPAAAGRAPGWTAVAATAGVLLLWANSHALFALGPLLLAAGLAGVCGRAWLAGRLEAGPAGEARARDRRIAGRLAAALAFGSAAGLANPLGAEQHLAFLRASGDAALFSVWDDWGRFPPFAWTNRGPALGLAAWLLADGLLLGVAAGLVRGASAWLPRPKESALRRFDPVRLALAVAGAAALLGSIRFLWMGIFPLVFLLAWAEAWADEAPRRRDRLALVLAAASLALLAGSAAAGGPGAALEAVPRPAKRYLAETYDTAKYPSEAVAFLRESRIEGRLFNPYALGGFLGYWLAPRLELFVDGRMNVPAEVLQEYHLVNRQRGPPFETFVDVLVRRRVDVFLGVGTPTGRPPREVSLYTAAHLERARGWIPVFRSIRSAVYLRRHAGNAENLRRISAYYARAGVPFDPEHGLDVAQVIAAQPGWAEAHNLVPSPYAAVLAQRRSPDPALRGVALDLLAQGLALAGAYEAQVALDREALGLRPGAARTWRRLVYGLLRLDRPAEALRAAGELERLDGQDPISRRFVRTARGYAERRRRLAGRLAPPAVPLDAPLNGLPLTD